MGVEEEYLLVGPDGVPVAVAAAVIEADRHEPTAGPGGALEPELKQQQIEIGTRPCTDLGDLAAQIREGRAHARAAAARVGAEVAALATSPVAAVTTVSPKPRYQQLVREFGITAREQLTCGCHVHVGVGDDEEGVAVLDRIRPWLPVLLALSANSPYWQGEDSGYASFRSQVWNRWPTAGPTARFGSAEAYHRTVEGIVATGTAMDAGMVYFDARLSARYPTVEVRVADVCLRADDATLVAALVRALIETAARESAAGMPAPATRLELLRAASWRASRSGLGGVLVNPRTFRPVPAREVVDELVDHVADALADTGDRDRVDVLLGRLWRRGTGADEQRAWSADGDVSSVVGHAARATQE